MLKSVQIAANKAGDAAIKFSKDHQLAKKLEKAKNVKLQPSDPFVTLLLRAQPC